MDIAEAAADSCFFPLYEIERGVTRITYDPDPIGRRVQVADLAEADGQDEAPVQARQRRALLASIEAEVERRWLRLKAKDENPLCERPRHHGTKSSRSVT